MKRCFPWAAAFTLALGVTAAQAAPTLLIDANGELIGADDVNVGGVLYDVRFIDGTCAAVFNGCASGNFDFATYAAADVASQALLDQVLLDGPGGNFDSFPDLTLGCPGSPFTTPFCQVITPVGQLQPELTGAYASDALNRVPGQTDLVSHSCCYNDLSAHAFAVWADWTLAEPAQVSEPGTLALAGVALLGMVGLRRRKSR